MNQTRTFLLAAWLMVAFLLWREWAQPPQAAATVPAVTASSTGVAVPTLSATHEPSAQAPVAPVATAAAPVQMRNDVLALTLDGGAVTRAELLTYRQHRDPGSPPVVLFNPDPATFYAAEAVWRDAQGRALAWRPQGQARTYALAPGQTEVQAVFVASDDRGVTVQRTFTLARGSYALRIRDEVINAGTTPWQGDIERRLERVPPVVASGFTNPESFSLNGAAWYSPQDKYKKRKYPDFSKDGPLNLTVTGGWVALSQHYFLTAWVPQADQPALFMLGQRGPLYSISAHGPAVTLAPGQRFTSTATLWVGPKLADQLDATAPGLGLAMDYGIFTALSKPIHWLLTQLHKLTGNWGWAIVLLVLLIKLLLYPLSAKQYQSMAKMRKFQPRIEQLKQRYGEDKQKFQMAMLDLYKKEKINPAGGCLPVLIQMPVFLALYYVLIEAVELRQAPWIAGWINDLTARDPYFILPLLNGLIMWLTQKMTPMVGMDPMQKKMMQLMPLVMAVMFAFFPAGLVLYWVTNGALGMLQQWWNTKRFAEAGEPA
jgi:YidC/Oxa1 family membrane protein insertase